MVLFKTLYAGDTNMRKITNISNCLMCKKEFGYSDKRSGKYCSKKCSYLSKRKNKERFCKNCNKKIITVPSDPKEFCNQKCSIEYKQSLSMKIKLSNSPLYVCSYCFFPFYNHKLVMMCPDCKQKRDDLNRKNPKTCPICNVTFLTHNKQKVYCSEKCHKQYQKNDTFYCMDCGNKVQKGIKRCDDCNLKNFSIEKYKHYQCRIERGKRRKEEIIFLKGGKCNECGYNKCNRSLIFHHREKEQKKFTLDQSTLYQIPMNDILIEVEKCDLLCQNCHAIHHEKERSLNDNNRKRKSREIKNKLIEYKGGKCEKCGFYSQYTQCMTFHHKIKEEKIFEINTRSCEKYDIDELKTESDKCELLCFNCHMEKEEELKNA